MDKKQAKIEKVMHEFKMGKLKSSDGDMIRTHEQALAIALSEAKKKKK